jgi:hypothetical protein
MVRLRCVIARFARRSPRGHPRAGRAVAMRRAAVLALATLVIAAPAAYAGHHIAFYFRHGYAYVNPSASHWVCGYKPCSSIEDLHGGLGAPQTWNGIYHWTGSQWNELRYHYSWTAFRQILELESAGSEPCNKYGWLSGQKSGDTLNWHGHHDC